MSKIIVLLISILFIGLLLWIIFKSIKEKQLPNRSNYTPFDNIMSGKTYQSKVDEFMGEENENNP